MKTFKKYYDLPASPEEVYWALTKAQSIQLWTGAEVEFKEEAGTEFSFWEGDIVGRNLEFDYGKKIVQQWYFGENTEPSIVTIKLHAQIYLLLCLFPISVQFNFNFAVLSIGSQQM